MNKYTKANISSVFDLKYGNLAHKLDYFLYQSWFTDTKIADVFSVRNRLLIELEKEYEFQGVRNENKNL